MGTLQAPGEDPSCPGSWRKGLPAPAPGHAPLSPLPLPWAQEYKRKQLEEQRQSERLQRQLQQEHAYLKSLQQQQQLQKQQGPPGDRKPLYHYGRGVSPADKPAWAREVLPLASLRGAAEGTCCWAQASGPERCDGGAVF